MNYKNLIYSITCLSFAVIIGGAVYEHLSVVPRWSAAPPRSLTMFQGEYGLNAQAFWKLIHPVTILLFIATLATSWKSARRINVLTAFIAYIAIIAMTAIYFVPELLAITTTPYADSIDLGLAARAERWENLSLIRLAVLVVLSLVLFFGLTKMDRTNKE
jgi:hypothetical protein